ncbi:alpha-amylase family glycosyl hydrolase, partial [Fulvivirga lutimaris]|uniref:alpha-amylase family glycosyl hydrolase n=1 Tax=Fulvivirga lutimaris TaxID=1819566 RepID=UPI001FE526F0
MAISVNQQELVEGILENNKIKLSAIDKVFLERLNSSISNIKSYHDKIYGNHPHKEELFNALIEKLVLANQQRGADLKKRDIAKEGDEPWFLSNQLVGMSLYVDRFAGSLNQMPTRLNYLENLGVNFLHLMPIFDSPENESDGGYAVSNFRKVNPKFGSLNDLTKLRKDMHKRGMYLMIDIVLNHTSYKHEWAKKAKSGDKEYQDYYYMYNNRKTPDLFEQNMPEVFPEGAPGNFTWVESCKKWVMSVFYNYQWDLNYSNPVVFNEMLDNILFYANLGVDVLRIDAPAFIWKKIGTTCQNLPEVHLILQLIKTCVAVVAPGMALLGEAIVAPKEIMKYFGEGKFETKECDFAYNATQMALQWDMLATGETNIMLQAQEELLKKPYGTSWISYARCHDDIGLGYDDAMIQAVGKNPTLHRNYIIDYYLGEF